MKYSVDEVIKVASSFVGYLEKSKSAYQKNPKVLDSFTEGAGSDNYTMFWRDTCPSFQGQPWCNDFVNFVFIRAYGESSAKELLCTKGDWSYYTPTSASYFNNNKQWYSTPQKGDIIYFKNSSRIHHVGLVYKVDNKNVYTIEGNTSAGSAVIPNGGSVCKKQYLLTNSSIAGYGRPNYGEEEIAIVSTPISCSREGLLIVGTSSLNIRTSPKDGKVVGTYKKGQRVQATAMSTASDGKVWLQTSQGWISASYVEGWIKISNDWKYITKGYIYLKSTVAEIDGEEYAFDKNGVMLKAERITNSGAIKY